jgi:tetratricopeptide (TPR) repeat protein
MTSGSSSGWLIDRENLVRAQPIVFELVIQIESDDQSMKQYPSIPLLGLTFLVLGCLLPGMLSAQLYPDRQSRFLEMVVENDRERALVLLREIMETDSNAAFRLADAAESMILPGQSHTQAPSQEDIDLLQRIYSSSARFDPAGPKEWHLRKGMLVLRYPDVYREQGRAMIRQAVTSAPFKSPLLLYEKWMDFEIADYEARRITLGSLAEDWRLASELLQSRLIRHADPNEPAGRVQLNLLLQLRDVFPECTELLRILRNDPNYVTCSGFLIIYALQDCYTEHEFWEKEFQCATEDGEKPWIYRLAAADALNRQELTKACAYLERAIELGEDPALKANDCLNQADILATQGDYRAAREQIEKAMEFQPAWGYPYIRLAELYLEGSKSCDFSPFDQKAVYWLAISLCQDARNMDPSVTLEADRRIFQYRLNAPNAEEARFRGLSDGDTWPLRCWMSTVTTVKTK